MERGKRLKRESKVKAPRVVHYKTKDNERDRHRVNVEVLFNLPIFIAKLTPIPDTTHCLLLLFWRA